tara:strand:+ start:179 stop:556 length:378 start_codon:yes stop_codon:yes gene_type:complete
MKKVVMLMMLAFASLTVFAQRNNDATPEERADRQTKQLTKSLALTEDQEKKVYALNLDRMKEMEEMRKSQSTDREKMKASQDKYQAEVGKILTAEQMEKYKATMTERRGGGGQGGQGGGQGRKRQ